MMPHEFQADCERRLYSQGRPFEPAALRAFCRSVWPAARRFVADLRVPDGTKPGRYRGAFEFLVKDKVPVSVPVTVEVLPFTLAAPDAYFAVPGQYHPLYVD